MIIDGRKISDAEARDFDIIIVGSGPAGITIALELEKSRHKVAILESGGRNFDSRAQELNDGTLGALDTTDLTAARLRMLGGTSNHWGGHCLPLDPIDFSRPPLSGLSGWPISYDDMRDYYESASGYCDIGSFGYDLSEISNLDDSDLLLNGGDQEIETKLIRQSTPTNFGGKFEDLLESSKNMITFLWTTVVSFNFDIDGRVTGLNTINIDGKSSIFRAKIIVLACGAVENARLLIFNNERLGTSYGNQGGFLGKCYMDHPVGGAAFLHLKPTVQDKANWSHSLTTTDDVDVHLVWRLSDKILEEDKLNNTQFFLIPLSAEESERQLQRDANTSLSSLKSILKWTIGRGPSEFSLSTSYCDFIQNADALAVHTYANLSGGEKVSRLLLRYESEQRPDKASYLALNSDAKDMFGVPLPTLHWSPSIEDRDSIVRSAIRIGMIAGARDIGRVELEDHFDERYWDAHTAWHQMGTTRMSQNASEGVVDSNCRVHGTKNLYVAGASVFPSGGRANPTLTVVALAVRLAEHLRDLART